MCSVRGIEKDCGLPLEFKRSLSEHPRKCMKCENNAVTIARRKDPFCGTCFSDYFIQRFRTTLGKSRLLNRGEKVLIAFSGGWNSRVLLQLVAHSVSECTGKKLPILPSVLFVDEGGILKQDNTKRCQTTLDVLSIARDTKFPCFYIQLEQVFSRAPTMGDFPGTLDSEESCEKRLLSALSQNESLLMHLEESFGNMVSFTAKENLLVTLRHRLLAEVARRHGYTKVLVGDNANRISARLLGNIAQGRGSAISLDTGLFDDRYEDVSLIRPLRELPHQEIMEYAALKELKVLEISDLHSVSNTVSSIEGVTEAFVNGLQADFSSTLNTIFRTGEKLSMGTDCSENVRCELCKAPLKQFVGQTLCYGCHLTMNDAKSSVPPLPFRDP